MSLCEHCRGWHAQHSPFNLEDYCAFKDPCREDFPTHPYIELCGYLNVPRFKDQRVQDTCQSIFEGEFAFLKEMQNKLRVGESLTASWISRAICCLCLSSTPWQLSRVTGLSEVQKVAEMVTALDSTIERWLQVLCKLLGPDSESVTFTAEEWLEFNLVLLRTVCLIYKNEAGNVSYLSWWDVLLKFAKEGEIQAQVVEKLIALFPLRDLGGLLKPAYIADRMRQRSLEGERGASLRRPNSEVSPRIDNPSLTFVPYDRQGVRTLVLPQEQAIHLFVNDLTLQMVKTFTLKFCPKYSAMLRTLVSGSHQHRISLQYFCSAVEDLFHYSQEKVSLRERWALGRQTLRSFCPSDKEQTLFALCDSAFLLVIALERFRQLNYPLETRDGWQEALMDCFMEMTPPERESIVEMLFTLRKGTELKRDLERLPSIVDFRFLKQAGGVTAHQLAWLFIRFAEADFSPRPAERGKVLRQELKGIIEKMEVFCGRRLEPEAVFALYAGARLPQTFNAVLTQLETIRNAAAECKELFFKPPEDINRVEESLKTLLLMGEEDNEFQVIKTGLAKNLWDMTLIRPVYITLLKELPPLHQGWIRDVTTQPLPAPIRANIRETPAGLADIRFECQWIFNKRSQRWKFRMTLMSSFIRKESVTVEILLDVPEEFFRSRKRSPYLLQLFEHLSHESYHAHAATLLIQNPNFQTLLQACYRMPNINPEMVLIDTRQSVENETNYVNVFKFLCAVKTKFRLLPSLLAALHSKKVAELSLKELYEAGYLDYAANFGTLYMLPKTHPSALTPYFSLTRLHIQESIDRVYQCILDTTQAFPTIALKVMHLDIEMNLDVKLTCVRIRRKEDWFVLCAEGRINQIEIKEEVAIPQQATPIMVKEWIFILLARVKSHYYSSYAVFLRNQLPVID